MKLEHRCFGQADGTKIWVLPEEKGFQKFKTQDPQTRDSSSGEGYIGGKEGEGSEKRGESPHTCS